MFLLMNQLPVVYSVYPDIFATDRHCKNGIALSLRQKLITQVVDHFTELKKNAFVFFHYKINWMLDIYREIGVLILYKKKKNPIFILT